VSSTIQAGGGLRRFLALPPEQMRATLLRTHGIGPETADAIALYAAGHRTFVVDAYTIRLFRRLGLGPEAGSYGEWQRYFDSALPAADARAMQRYHAWIVLHAKARCRTVPRCEGCPLDARCQFSQERFGARVTA
jgi:endonuclease-3 related protein